MEHAFQFVDSELQRRLVAEFAKRGIAHSVGPAGDVRFADDTQDVVENDLICEIRESVFAAWQIVTCPEADVGAYRAFMSTHEIPFREEISDGERWFSISQDSRPHSWNIEASATAKTTRSVDSLNA
ncbi:MAG: hypothetical protein WCL32_13730 [Planctomycetota bacterium]